MEIAIFSKKRTTKDGKPFQSFITRLNKKDGTTQTVGVRFDADCEKTPKPEQCPMNIVVKKEDAHLSTRNYTREDTGEIGTRYTLWVSAWTPGKPWVDTSLDEYEV